MNRGWVVSILTILLIACSSGSFVADVVKSNPEKTVTFNRVSGENLQLLRDAYGELCPSIDAREVIRVSLAGNNSTETELYTPSGKRLCSFSTDDQEVAEQVTAVRVANRTISLAEFRNTMREQPRGQRNARQALRTLVNREILLQEAERQGIAATEQEIRSAAQNLNQTQLQRLDEQGLRAVQERLRQRIVIQKVRNALRQAVNVTVTEGEARRFYENNSDLIRRPERFRFRQIQIDKGNASEAAREKTNTVYDLRNESSFCSLVRQFTDDTDSRERCGRYTFTPEQMRPAVAREIGNMRPNETRIVESPQAFHIIHFLERKPAGTASFDEVRSRVEQIVAEQKRREAVQQYLRRLRQNTQVTTYLR